MGILGGKPGRRSEKLLVRADGTSERLPSKCDEVRVESGDMLVYRTAGGGGWKDPLDRPAAIVEADVRKGLVSADAARAESGVIVGDAGATVELRDRMRAERGEVKDFDFGPDVNEIVERARDETGLEPPSPPEPLRWAPLEPGEAALARVRERDDRQMTRTE